MYISWRIIAGLASAVILSGCAAPFADSVAYDTKVRDAPGTITLSDPKLYTREALISERAKDIKWIDSLISKSEDPTKVVFKPELVREVEQITAMAAAIGLKFDPAAAVQYGRDKETSGIQHEMDLIQLRLQLDQLKRDAELVRDQFGSQTTPVNEDIGKLGDGSAQEDTTVTASAVDQLKVAIDELNTTLTSRLDAEGKPAKATAVTSSPFDDFRDRNAYRDMLKAAENAAGLDQLHDYSNARLIRLNFQASVLPDSDNPRSIGAVQVHVVPPNTDSAATQQFLRHWLEYINTSKKYRSGTSLKTEDLTIAELLLSDSFEIVNVLGVELLLPVIVDGDGRPQSPSNIYRRSGWDTTPQSDLKNYKDVTSEFSIDEQKTADILNTICTQGPSIGKSDLIEKFFQQAVDRELSIAYIRLANKVARTTEKVTIPTDVIASKLVNASVYREQVLQKMRNYSQCKAYVQRSTAQPRWRALLNRTMTGTDKVRIYEIGPREQVQQVSTVAQSARSLALAASIAASDPGSGVGAEAAGSYSRQAMGRATALERVPSVVGYSQAGDGSFGWVLGPRAVLNARGRIDMAQLLKTYDLSVDLSVPGWWPAFDLEVITAWAPSPLLITSGTLPANVDNPHQITVPLVSYSADEFDALTQYMTGTQDRSAVIERVLGGPVNPCAKSTLLITGRNIWRTKQVFVLGQALGTEAITIMPDMKSILLSVPAIKPLPNGNFSKTLYVITPFGMSQPKPVTYVREPSGEGCKPAKKQTGGAAADAFSISDVKPLEFIVPSSLQIQVTGTNLDKIGDVKLGSQPGTLEVEDKGKSLTVKFDDNQTSSIRAFDNTPLEFFEKGKTTATVTKYVRTQNRK